MGQEIPIVNALNARIEQRTVLTPDLFTNRWLWLSLGAVLLLQVAVVHLPLMQTVSVTVAPQPSLQWIACAGAAVSVLDVEEDTDLLIRGRR